MQHPFSALESEYASWVAHAEVRPECAHLVDGVAGRLVHLWQQGHYRNVSAISTVPVLFMAPSFEREASSNFALSPAQGDRWDQVSRNVPRGVGPFQSWDAAALWSYHHDGLDLVGAGAWTWPLLCYYFELFNGFGYRDFHHIRSPYVVGATTLQQPGKYVRDGEYDPNVIDSQIGCLALALRMSEIAPDLLNQLAAAGAKPAAPAPAPIPATTPMAAFDTKWLQASLNTLTHADIDVDGNYGRQTRAAVLAFQRAHPPLSADGFAGPKTIAVAQALLEAA